MKLTSVGKPPATRVWVVVPKYALTQGSASAEGVGEAGTSFGPSTTDFDKVVGKEAATPLAHPFDPLTPVTPIYTHEQLDAMKLAAAEAAVKEIRNGDKVGIGTGSTVNFAIAALGKRLKNPADPLKSIIAVSSSKASGQLATEQGIALTTLDDPRLQGQLDISIDGADQVGPGPQFPLVKGGGGALEGEFPVASKTRRLIIIVDKKKRTDLAGFGRDFALPVAIDPARQESLEAQLQALGATPVLRRDRADPSKPFVTDAGSHILDCTFPKGIADPESMSAKLNALESDGVRRAGLFLHLACDIFVGEDDGSVIRLRP